MKTTYFITDADSAGWCAIQRGVWDGTVPIREASAGWPVYGVTNADNEIEQFVGPTEDREMLDAIDLKPGMTITWEEG